MANEKCRLFLIVDASEEMFMIEHYRYDIEAFLKC